jgi:hypothetical protein
MQMVGLAQILQVLLLVLGLEALFLSELIKLLEMDQSLLLVGTLQYSKVEEDLVEESNSIS